LRPFITHGGYGVGSAQGTLASLAPAARIQPAFVMEADQERAHTVNASNADDVLDAIAAAKHPLLAEIAGLKASVDGVRDGRSSETTSGGDGWFDVSGRVRRRIGAMLVVSCYPHIPAYPFWINDSR
jgi:hypothetical protein